MNTVKDTAICIRRRNYSETSQILTFFAKTMGKIRAIAKGSRREKSKFKGAVELLAAGEAVFTKPKTESGLVQLCEFELQETFGGLRQNLLSVHCAQYAAEMVDQFTEELDPNHEPLFETLYQTLNNLAKKQRPEATLLCFEVELLKEIGLAPQWDRCCNCGCELKNKENVHFSSKNNGLLCRDCEPAFADKKYVGPEILLLLQQPQQAYLTADGKITAKTHEIISEHQRELLGKEPAIMTMLNKLMKKI